MLSTTNISSMAFNNHQRSDEIWCWSATEQKLDWAAFAKIHEFLTWVRYEAFHYANRCGNAHSLQPYRSHDDDLSYVTHGDHSDRPSSEWINVREWFHWKIYLKWNFINFFTSSGMIGLVWHSSQSRLTQNEILFYWRLIATQCQIGYENVVRTMNMFLWFEIHQLAYHSLETMTYLFAEFGKISYLSQTGIRKLFTSIRITKRIEIICNAR